MKKIFAFLLALSIAAAAFAEFRFNMDATVATNAYGIIIPTGLHAEPYIADPDSGEKTPNTGIPGSLRMLPMKSSLLYLPLDPDVHNFFNGAYIPISQSFFRHTVTPNGFRWTEGSGLGLTMQWNGNNVESMVKFGAGRLMNYLMYAEFPNEKRGTDDNPINGLVDLFNMVGIEEYFIRANTSLFIAHFGNRGGGGKTDDMQDHTDWIPTPVRVDGFGVNIPSPEGPMARAEDGGVWRAENGHRNLHNIGAKDFLFGMRGNSWATYDFSSYFVGTIKMDRLIPDIPFPLWIDLGFDFDPGIFSTGEPFWYENIPGEPSSKKDTGVGHTRVGGGIRISGDMAFNIVTFDLAYKLRGGDPTPKMNDTWDEEKNPHGAWQPDGKGSVYHILGAYFSMPNLVPDLSIGFGYTALFRTHEDEMSGPPSDDDRYTIETQSPFFSGIDLFLRYSGIQDLRITFKNNFSFAAVPEPVYNGDDNVTVRRFGVDGYELDRYNSQSWFAWYSSIAAKFLVTGRLSFFLEAISHLGVSTEINSDGDRTGGLGWNSLNSWGKRVRTKHTLSAALYASHQFNSLILLQLGVSVFSEQSFTKLSDFNDDIADYAPTSFEAGALGIAVPLVLKFTW